MKIKTIIYFVFIVASMFHLNSCNKDSYIEEVGFVNNVEIVPDVPSGKILFYATNGFIETCSNGLQVFIDGNNVGNLTQSTASTPNCGENSTRALTVTLEVGTYYYNASGSGEFCPAYSGNTFTIEENVCLQVNFGL